MPDAPLPSDPTWRSGPPSRSGPVALAALLGALALATGCRTARYLEEGEVLVRKVDVRLADGAKGAVEDWTALSVELERQLTTQPNGKFLFVAPREWFYLRGEARGDSTRYRSFVQRIIAEPPAYLSAEDLDASERRLASFMRNRGYFDATARSQVDTTRDHFAKVTYTVTPELPYRYREVRYETENPLIAALLDNTASKRVLQAGRRVDSRDYDREVARIVSLLRDNGFAEFYANSISPLEADSAGRLVDATLRVLPPEVDRTHRTFRVGRITVFPDNDPLATATTVMVDSVSDGLRFIYSDEAMDIDPATLSENIFFRSGQLFDQSAITKTNLQLNNLGVFRFVTIRQEPSPDQDGEIDFYIELSLAERWEIGADVELSFTDRQAVSGGRLNLIGGQVAGSLSNRNLAGGAEVLSLSANAGLEFNLADLGNAEIQRLNTVEFGGVINYGLPRFVDYFGIYRGLNRVKSGLDDEGEVTHVVGDDFYRALVERGRTNLSLAANYTDLLNFYRTTSVSSTFGYEVAPSINTRVTVNHVGLEYFNVTSEPSFEVILAQTPFLQRSLGDQVFSAFLLRNVTVARRSPARRFGGEWTFLFDLEQSGAEVTLANKLRNALSDQTGPFDIGSGLDYARYGRFVTSAVLNRPLGSGRALALRLVGGGAFTYGFLRRERDVPYVRQFFGGGTASLRGWQARAVGPGGYEDLLAINDATLAKYQQANIQLEANLEYRSFLTRVWTSALEGALFVDAGNIWTTAFDPDRPGSQFRLTELRGEDGTVINEPFYDQVAVNAGLGLRLDIGYALFRVDLGFKLRNPYPIGGTHWPGDFGEGNLSRTNWALGLNYPF